jgi:tagatose-6-phosphate ketose/aldose isomerase
MKIWDYTIEELKEKGGYYTAKEIYSQPKVWHQVFDEVVGHKEKLGKFRNMVLQNEKLHIILTGAGTSAFIGLTLQGIFKRSWNNFTTSIATTDLVSHPMDYLNCDEPTLLISFARSGNSPESIAAVELADQICKKCFHLIITCDKDGKLANYKSKNDKYVFLLPPESNDMSLAMTSSYSGMLLAGILIAHLDELETMNRKVDILCNYGEKILNQYSKTLYDISGLDFKRVVFLGSGPQFGTATESHLKLQELTDGNIICKTDSYLGFRHGPKAVIDNTTLVVYLFSNQPYVMKYENDFVNAMKTGKKALYEVGIMETKIDSLKLDNEIILSDRNSLEEEFLSVCNVIPAQMLGFFKSLRLGLQPDAPSESGAISRVVKGVIIYPYVTR